MSDKDDILRKVRALLAKAEDSGATPEEAKTFSEAAQKLMAKYAIEEALLTSGQTTGRGEVGVEYIRIKKGNYEEGSWTLLSRVARINRCFVVIGMHREIDETVCDLIGAERDREITLLFWRSLGIQMITEMFSVDMRKTKGNLRSFQIGYADEIHWRLAQMVSEAEKEAEEEHKGDGGPGVGLVLRHNREAVEDYVKEHYPRLGSIKRTTLNSAAYGAGKDAGRRADLGQSKVGRNRPQIGR